MDRKPLLWIVAITVAFIAVWQLASAQGEKEKVGQRWQYKVLFHDAGDPTKALAQQGDEGWELVAVHTEHNNNATRLYLKRPK